MKIKQRWRYSKSKDNGKSPQQQLPSNTAILKQRLYSDCRVKLDVFETCLYDKDYSGLVITGNFTGEEIDDTDEGAVMQGHSKSCL